MWRATGLSAESDDLGPWPGKREERIYTTVLSEQLRRSERLRRAVADPGIDRRGGGGAIFAKKYTHHSWHSYALEGSGKILKSKGNPKGYGWPSPS